MKKILSLAFAFFALCAFSFAQVSVDINDPFYSDAQGWELRGLTSTLPQLRPYPLNVVARVLNDVIENGSEKDIELATSYKDRIFAKSIYFYAYGNGNLKFSSESHDGDTEKSKTKAGVIDFALGGDASLHPLASVAYKIGLYCRTKEFSEYSPLYTNILEDAIFDPTESGPFTNYMTWNANASVGNDSIFGTLGMNRIGFGPFYGDGLALNDTGYHSANIVFNATREKWSYASVYETIGSTRNIKDVDDNWLGGNKYLAFHSIKWHSLEKFSLTYYENIVFGPYNNFSYFAPAPYMGLQNIGGASDNLQMGLLLEFKPVKGLEIATDFFADDLDLNEMFKGNFDSKLRFGFQGGFVYTPGDSILSKISLSYTAIMPYVYSHWEYNDNKTGEFDGYTWNYQNYTNGGINIGSTLDPNSDKITLSAHIKPSKNLSVNLFGNLIRHANSAEDFSDDEAAEYMLAKPKTYTTDGSLYMSQMYSDPESTHGSHVDSAWEKLGFMTSDHKMYVAQLGLNAEYTFARTKAGAFSICAGYTFEYVKNAGVNRSIFNGGLCDALNIIKDDESGMYKIGTDAELYTWDQVKKSQVVQNAVKAARESWENALYDCKNHYVSVSMKYSY